MPQAFGGYVETIAGRTTQPASRFGSDEDSADDGRRFEPIAAGGWRRRPRPMLAPNAARVLSQLLPGIVVR